MMITATSERQATADYGFQDIGRVTTDARDLHERLCSHQASLAGGWDPTTGTGSVTFATVERAKQALADLGYRPSQAAR